MSTSTPAAGPRFRRAATAVGIVFALLVVFGSGALYALYRHLDSNITIDHSADSELRSSTNPTATAATQYQAENILIMGSDTRVGQHGEGGSAKVYSTAQSDVVMVVHLSADRKRALVMSIPRDTWVRLPTCTGTGGKTVGGFDAKFNEAFTLGGPACTIKLVKEVTGLPIDHFVVIDFNGVKEVINALGGVQFCLKTALKDPIGNGQGSGLNLPAGHQLIMGDQGLAFLRARHNIGDGSDIGRMDRQHAFMGAMIKQVQDASLLTHPTELYSILDAATKAITTDPGLGHLSDLKNLAGSVSSLKPKAVTFLTIPWVPRGDGSNVLIDQPKAQPILDAITNDTAWPPPRAAATARALTVPPSAITVEVLNATGRSGQGAKVADQLRALGFTVSSVGTAPAVSAATVVRYSPGYDQSGRTLTASVTHASSVPDSTLGSTLVLVVGTSFTGVHAVTLTVPGSSTTPADTITAASTGCV